MDMSCEKNGGGGDGYLGLNVFMYEGGGGLLIKADWLMVQVTRFPENERVLELREKKCRHCPSKSKRLQIHTT